MSEMLSTHFSRAEIEASDAALRFGYVNRIPEQHPKSVQCPQGPVEVWKLGCERVLERVRAEVNAPLIISSGYRSPHVNRAVGGSSYSQHTGFYQVGKKLYPCCAFDVKLAPEHGGNRKLWDTALRMLAEKQIIVDQLIDEFNLAWVHFGIGPESLCRGELLRAVYKKGIVYERI